MNAEPQDTPVRRAEELDEQLAEILEFSRERVAEYRKNPKRIVFNSESFPDASELLTARLQAALEDEIIPAKEMEQGRIQAYELNREVIKKALVGLKMPALKRVAKQVGLMTSMSAERLAESVAHYHGWDEEEIARLVLENEEVVRPERGFVSRFFPLREAPEVARVRARLDYVRGRYIRTGIARWFVFNEVESEDERHTEMLGSLRSYTATLDDRNVDEPRLTPAVAIDSHARVLIDGTDLLTVRGASLGVARAAVQATQTATDIEPYYRVPFIDPSAPSVTGELHSASKFMVDLLVNRFPSQGLSEVNLTVARFKIGEDREDDTTGSEGPERRADLRAVRFEGNYLLGSKQACHLLTVEQRALSDMTIQVVLRNRERVIIGRYPVRVSIERDHVAVETSYGVGNIEASAQVHSNVTECVIAEIEHGLGNEDRLDEFTERIRARADAPDTEDPLDLLSAQ